MSHQYTMEPSRTKTFYSRDSLKCAQMRLDTFINWPVEWLNPQDLVNEGFYYLRVADHCSCAFCCKVVHAWIEGDTPRSRHAKVSPNCSFIRGEKDNNVPLEITKLAFEYGLDFFSPLFEPKNIATSDREYIV